MTDIPQTSLYEQHLGTLVGDDFEQEVCVRMQGLVSDYQRVPAKPHGDGGLDGLSHGQETAYCCYGPEQVPAKLARTDGLKKEIVKKFSADLRRLYELETYGRGRLRHAENAELGSILGQGRLIRRIRLVVSWFESHRVIGPLNTVFDRYRSASKGRYVHPDATLTIWGPRDLAALGALDEHTVFRMENRVLLDRVKNAKPASLPKASVADFDAKFEYLRGRRPERAKDLDALAKHFRTAWAAAVALDNELASTSVALHESLEIARQDAATSARLKSMGSDAPDELLLDVRQEVLDRLKTGLGERLGMLSTKVADGVVGGLIGECPLEWRGDRNE